MMNKTTEINISLAASMAHLAAHGTTSEHAPYHSPAALKQHHAQVQDLPIHSSKH